MAARKTTGTKERGYVLEVPLDTTAIGEGDAQELRVVAVGKRGTAAMETVTVRAGGQQSVALSFSEHPGAVRVLVGPASATAEELSTSQTIAVDVPSRVWAGPKAVIDPVRISPYFWWWWPWWCREYVVRGRVVCADGSPVPGAQVCAYDVDWLWWWSSTEQVGCDTTDINGAFEIRFRWCCGRWPWWWWKYRAWKFDPILVDKIKPVLERDPRIELGRT
ncbi:MAG TPA: carboxypeptidase-like regulatory domain-containing protein, partial [Kribbellaceae bacterium]|nr:carboxypeptidase-like regulatory domain-containing protein [Kribbellaceae bacterium]